LLISGEIDLKLSELQMIGQPIFRQQLISRAEMRLRLSLPIRFRRAIAGGYCLCPVCNSRVAEFRNFGPYRRAWCPVCAAMPRHREVWVYLKARTSLFDGVPKRMLHIAPEPAFVEHFSKTCGLDYVTADLDGTNVSMQMDITDIRLPDATFDVIHCSHVLEHVPDDRKAMRELCRILRPNGWALFMVPISVAATVEDPSITDPAERERLFGQHDHVRRYGPDFADRLREEGFRVTVTYGRDLASDEDRHRMGFSGDEAIYHCTRA
jgi:SAM-dependent methyltransferase